MKILVNRNSVTVRGFYTILILFVSRVFCDASKNEIAVKNFRDYLRINTAHFNPDYDSAILWLQEQARGLGLKYNFVQFSEIKSEFAVWLTWPGLDPSLQSVYLHSHIDVVAVDSGWTHDPFGAEMDMDGNIFGRGAQDMKSAGVQYLEAIRNMKSKGVTPNRTLHVGFLPDEERGGGRGFALFVLTPQFKALNIGFVLDEGTITDDPTKFHIFYAIRHAIWSNFTATGDTGHGSLLMGNTAAEKILKVINKMMALRESEKSRLEANNTLLLGDVTSINLNILEGGMEANVIPPRFSAVFDMRISPEARYADLMKFLNDTCTEAGPNVTYEILHTTFRIDQETSVTKLDEGSWWWTNFQKAFKTMNLTIVPRVFPQGSDGQVTRNLGIPTLGFSPIFNTTMLFHSRDEYLNVDVFLKGIEIYETLIQMLVYDPPPSDTSAGSSKKPAKGKSSAPITLLRSSVVFRLICGCLFYSVLF